MKALLTPAAKRRITDDWVRLFPELGIYQPLHLLRRVGPLLEGIALDRDSSNSQYYPTFHVHCLVRDDTGVSLMLWDPLRSDRSGTRESITVASHEKRYGDAANRLKQQAPLPLSGDLRFDDVLAAYRAFLERPGIHYDPHLYEEMAAICSWMGRGRDAEHVIDEATTVARTWPPNVLREPGGVAAWRARMTDHVRDSAALRMFADDQARALGAADLPIAELVA